VRGALVIVLIAGPARAERVIDRTSSWDSAGARIYTDVVIERDDGTLVSERVPGGVVGDVGMVQFHSTVGTRRLPLLLGFVPSRTRAGTSLHWEAGCVIVTPDRPGTTHIDGGREFDVIRECASHWDQMTSDCGYLKINVGAPQSLEVAYDGVNMIKFREDDWCPPAREACEEPSCYDSSAAGVTTVFYIDRQNDPSDGEIIDADVEINAKDFAIFDQGVTRAPGGTPADLANTLTHELGHLVGLDHNCSENPSQPALDQNGNPAPGCDRGSAPLDVVDATMYAYQDPPETGLPETKKATLEQDDIDAFCAAYPIAEDPGFCRATIVRPAFIGGCTCKQCAVAGPGARRAAPAAALLLALGALLLRRRKV
jgi:MYXO-CTERM domain-containing protein